MPEEEQQQKPLPLPEIKPQPETYAAFLNKHFGMLVFASMLMFSAAFVPINGKTLITGEQLAIGLAILVLVFVLVPSMAFFKKKPFKVSEILPVDPLEEMLLLQEKYARAGRHIELLWNDSDPWEGEGAGQPEVFQYFGHEVLADGTRVPIVLAQGSITKLPTKFLPRRYIETAIFSAAGTRKRPTEPGPRQQQPLFVSRPTEIRYVVPEREVLGKKEEGEEKEQKEEEE